MDGLRFGRRDVFMVRREVQNSLPDGSERLHEQRAENG
jgi:hypothetical protein